MELGEGGRKCGDPPDVEGSGAGEDGGTLAPRSFVGVVNLLEAKSLNGDSRDLPTRKIPEAALVQATWFLAPGVWSVPGVRKAALGQLLTRRSGF